MTMNYKVQGSNPCLQHKCPLARHLSTFATLDPGRKWVPYRINSLSAMSATCTGAKAGVLMSKVFKKHIETV